MTVMESDMDGAQAGIDASSTLMVGTETSDHLETPACLTNGMDPCRLAGHGRILDRKHKSGGAGAKDHPCEIRMTEIQGAENRKSLAKIIREHAGNLPEGTLIRAKDLLHLGNRAAIHKALSRLAEQGQFLRVSRGIYVRTIEGEFGRYAPLAEKVVRNIALTNNETIKPHAAIAAKNWGLTTQVPLRIGYITSGRERVLKFGGQTVRLRRAPSWQFDVGNRIAGDALRALDWVGPYGVADALRILERKLSASDLHEMRLLASTRRAGFPSWLAKRVGEALEE